MIIDPFTVFQTQKGLWQAFKMQAFSLLYDTRNPLLIKLLQKLVPYPNYIEIETTTRCPLKCIMCEHTYWHEPSINMDIERFKYLLDQFPRLEWIGLTGIGESFMNKDFAAMLKLVKERNIMVELYDPLIFTRKKDIELLVDLGIDQVYISLDAATKETYEKIRIGSNFDKVIENIKYLIRYKWLKETSFPNLDFHFIISSLNMHEMQAYLDFVYSVSPHSKILFTVLLHRYKEIEGFFQKVPPKLIEAIDKRAQEINMNISWNLNVRELKPPISCCTTWTMPFIFVTGEVIPCCSNNEANNRDFQKETSLGNVFEDSFSNIWWGKKYNELRKLITENKKPLVCRDCCIYN